MRYLTIFLNIALRVAIIYFLAEAWIFQDDVRFAGKAIPLRNTIIVGGLSIAIPVFWILKKKAWGKYPWGLDTLYLSIFGLDMFGNSFNLYNTYYYFDLIPHFHGTGALALLIIAFWKNLKRLATWETVVIATSVATLIHAGLEMQEYYTDVLAGTINVRGQSDTINDLAVGIVGTLVYTIVGLRLFLKRNPS